MRASLVLAVVFVAALAAHARPYAASDSPSTDSLVVESWSTVGAAKAALESGQAAAIPAVIALLDRRDTVRLTGTADLIYPGAKEFYGHGYLVDYDLDRIDVRAGWVLEETTFQNFGFSEGSIRESDLLQATMRGKADHPLSDVVTRPAAAARDARIAEARDRAKAWWAKAGAGWSRLGAVREALASDDVRRQMNVLGWLRYGETKCDGLDRETYRSRILPLVQKLKSSGDEGVSRQAKLLADGSGGERWR